MSDENPTSGTHTLVEKVRLERWSYVSVNIEVNVRGHLFLLSSSGSGGHRNGGG